MISDAWSRENIAWAAGFIEGEGCVTRQVTTKRSKSYQYWQLKVTNTDLDTLQKLQAILGCGTIYEKHCRNPKPHWKRAWQLKVYRQPELYAVLVAIFPFMCARRETRIAEALVTMGARGPWKPGRRPGTIGLVPYQSLQAGR